MSEKVNISNEFRSLIISELRRRNMKQVELGNILGKSKSWTTKLLNGSLRTLSGDDWNAIFDLFEMTLESVENDPTPVEIIQLQKACKTPESLKLALDLADYLNATQSSNNTIPYIPTEDLVAHGEEIVRAVHEDPNKAGKIGRISIVHLSQIIERLNDPSQEIINTEEHDTSLLGCIAAGSPIYTGEVQATIRTKKAYPSGYYALQVIGDSMEPIIPDGSTIILRPMQGREAKEGRIYAVHDSDGATLKQLMSKNVDGKKEYYLHSANPKMKDFTPMEDAQIQGEFVEVLD